MCDAKLIAEYLATDGGPDDPAVHAIASEIARRRFDIAAARLIDDKPNVEGDAERWMLAAAFMNLHGEMRLDQAVPALATAFIGQYDTIGS